MPRKTKAELAAEKEALENTEMEAVQQEPEQEATLLSAEEEGLETTDTTSLPEEEPQEAAIAGLLADYSAASRDDSGEENEPEPQGKSPLPLRSQRLPLPAGAQGISPPRARPFFRPTSAPWTETSLRSRCRSGTASMPPTAPSPSSPARW